MTLEGALGSWLLLGLGLAVAGVLAEVTLRAYSRAATSWVASRLRYDPYEVLVEPFGTVGYRPRPGGVFRYDNGSFATMNSQGFRGPTVAIPKPAGTVRIVLLGGSTTGGWGVQDDETVDLRMREILRARFPGRTFEVVNLAVDGYDSYQILERLRFDALRYQPDLVIVNEGINDVRNGRFPDLADPDPRTILWLSVMERLREEARRGGPTFWTRAKHYSFLARLPGILREGWVGAPATIPVETPHPDALDYYERNLTRIVEAATRESVRVLLSTHPSSLLTKYAPGDRSPRDYWIKDPATTQAYRDRLDERLRRVVQTAQERGLEVRRIPTPNLGPELFLDDAHLTAEGNRRLAEAFVAALEPWLAEIE